MLITCLWLLNYIYCIKYKMLNQFFFLFCFQQLPPVSEIIVESHAREQSKFGYQSCPRSFGSHVTVQSSVHPPVRPHHRATMWNLTFFRWCESLQLDIVHPCCDQLTAVKTEYALTSIRWPFSGQRCRPIEVTCFYEVIQVTSIQFQVQELYL